MRHLKLLSVVQNALEASQGEDTGGDGGRGKGGGKETVSAAHTPSTSVRTLLHPMFSRVQQHVGDVYVRTGATGYWWT